MKTIRWFWYLLILTLLVVSTFGESLQYTFWKDEWSSYIAYTHGSFGTVLWMHPGSVFIELCKTWIFGANVLGWQAVGLVLKIVAAYAVMHFTSTLTRSRKAGILSGIFFSITIIGADAVTWGAANVGLFDTILVCFTFVFCIQAIEEKNIWKFVVASICCFLAFVSDIARTAPLCIMGLFYMYLFTPYWKNGFVRRCIIGSIGIGMMALSIFVFLNSSLIIKAPIIQYIVSYAHDPVRIVGRLYLVGRFGNSFVYMLVGWIIPIFEQASTGRPTIVGECAGWSICIGYLFIVIRAVKEHSKKYIVALFFITWIFLFYVPNFLVEPRLVYGPTHRFFVLPSIGFISLFAYGISHIRSQLLFLISSFLFILFNIMSVHRWEGDQHLYRDREMTDYVYNMIQNKLPYDRLSLFMVTGPHPFVTYGAGYAMNAPILFIRQEQTTEKSPLYVRDLNEMYGVYCKKQQIYSLSIMDIYAWEISSEFEIQDISESVREKIAQRFTSERCKFIP